MCLTLQISESLCAGNRYYMTFNLDIQLQARKANVS